jgi:hypothetical protein
MSNGNDTTPDPAAPRPCLSLPDAVSTLSVCRYQKAAKLRADEEKKAATAKLSGDGARPASSSVSDTASSADIARYEDECSDDLCDAYIASICTTVAVTADNEAVDGGAVDGSPAVVQLRATDVPYCSYCEKELRQHPVETKYGQFCDVRCAGKQAR